MATKTTPKATATKQKTPAAQPRKMQTTLVPHEWAKKSSTTNGLKGKPKATANGNIMTFFKKAEEQNNRLFMQERRGDVKITLDEDEQDIGWSDGPRNGIARDTEAKDRFNENGGSVKRRKLGEEAPVPACTPPPQDGEDVVPVKEPTEDEGRRPTQVERRAGPFVDDSDSESDKPEPPFRLRGMENLPTSSDELVKTESHEENAIIESLNDDAPSHDLPPPPLKSETTYEIVESDFDDFAALEDDELLEGEEYDERRYMEEQSRAEMAEAGIDGCFDNFDAQSMFPDEGVDLENTCEGKNGATTACPLCTANLAGLNDQEATIHVNACLDGNPLPLPQRKPPEYRNSVQSNGTISKMFKKPSHPAKPGQQNPFQFGEPGKESKSAFSKLMANHAEDAAWANAAASESAARGKPSYQRTCPFYKILPGFYICVDAFRYGAVKGQNAYFLSHFHSDHYVGLTASWVHGPIYCSKVTANLVRQQLRVDPKWVVDLEFEKKTEVPGTEGVYVTMIPANHCPGSSLFLFEKEIGKGKNTRFQRVLHCGDFRACQAHIEHHLLKPEVLDVVSGKNKQQKLDVCYLDTTYLNPKYAFPPQSQVIQACADMCVSLSKERADETDSWEQMKRDRAGEGMVRFAQKSSDIVQEDEQENDNMKLVQSEPPKKRGRLLVVVGTYSIGKERICVGIAKALGSKIYASKIKQRICHALEDQELNDLLTSDPHDAQVHMTPLFEIRAETLDDYLRDYREHFSRVIGFRPSGWNYRPPKGRFTESPSVQTVLYSQSWKSTFSMRDLTPQPGSTHRAKCFGVPYSEHSSFRELTMFVCALRIDKIIPTVNVGSAKSREKMKAWCEKWATEKKKNGLFKLHEDDSRW